jgi:hypothetical protein
LDAAGHTDHQEAALLHQSTSDHSNVVLVETEDGDDTVSGLTIEEELNEVHSARRPSVSSETTKQDNDEKNKNKNLEIRRLSATEEGNRILNDAWESPEKEDALHALVGLGEGVGGGRRVVEKSKKKKTPLQMVENIVSNIELPSADASSGTSGSPSVSGTSSPLTTSSLKGNKSGKSNKNVLLPPLAHYPPAWTQTGRAMMHSQQQQQQQQQHQQPMLLPRDPNRPPYPQPIQPSPVMQLVNTINGPVLMQTVPTNYVQIPTSAGSSITLAPQLSTSAVRPILKKRKRKPAPLAPMPPTLAPTHAQGAKSSMVPILMSPTMGTLQQTGQAGGHILAISPQQQGSSQLMQQSQQANFVLSQAPGQMQAAGRTQMLLANGTLVTIPPMQTTGVVLNQMPDGTFVQVHNAAPSAAGHHAQQQGMLVHPTAMLQGGQQIITAGGQLLVNPNGPGGAGGQFIQNHQGGGTLYMTSQGLVQATPVSTVQQQQQQGVVTSSPQLLVQTSPSVQVMANHPLQMSPMQHQQQQQQQQQPPVLQRQQSLKVSPSKQLQQRPIEEEVHDVKDSDSSSDSDEDDDEDEDDDDEEDDEDEVQEITGEEKQVKLKNQTSPNNSRKPTSSSSTFQSSLSTSPSKSRGGGRQQKKSSGAMASSSTPLSSPDSAKSSPRTPFIQSNQVDSSGLKATPPYSGSDFETPTSHRGGCSKTEAPEATVSTSQMDDDDEEDHPDLLDTSTGGGVCGHDDSSSSGGGRASRTGTSFASTSGGSGKKRRKRTAEQILREEVNFSDGSKYSDFITRSLSEQLADRP